MARKDKAAKNAADQAGREWFDRDYTARQVYGRLWGFARRYKGLIFTGAFLGMLTGGLWAPLFSAIQPLLVQVQLAAPAQPAETRTNLAGRVSRIDGTEVKSMPVVVPRENAVAPDDDDDDDMLDELLRKAKPYFEKFGIRGEFTTMFLLGIGMVLAVVFKMLTQYLNQYYLTKAGMKVVMDVRNAMFAHLQAQSLVFHGASDVGKLMSRATGDPETIRTLISQTMSDLCRAPFEVLTAILFVCWFAIDNGMLSLLLTAVIGYPLCMLPIVWVGRQIRRWTKRLLEQSAGIGSNFHENLTCIRVVKAYHTEASEISKYEDCNLRAFKMCMRAARFSISVGPMTETVAILLAVAFVGYCFVSGYGLDKIVPLIPPFLILYKPMKQIGRLQAAIENGRAALQRIFSLLDVHEELVEKPDALPIKSFSEGVEFRKVDFAYRPGAPLTLKHISFTLRPGEMYAVVGSTGSGKSTISNLLARFYDASAGQVLLDGHDIRDYRIADLRDTIGAVTQESLLFNTTIAENIAYGSPQATREQIEDAARLANAHDFIMAHPEGYDRVVGEKGFVLSGGERQRIAIARAVLKNPPILILDEATSALDTVTEQQVQEALNHLMKNRTIFAIAHRLSTIRRADCILVLDRGEIVERGTHDELYAKGGAYRRLCDIQNQQH